VRTMAVEVISYDRKYAGEWRIVPCLSVTRGADVYKLGGEAGIDPMELLRMINAKVVPTMPVLGGLAK
jgi:hypothetical protein